MKILLKGLLFIATSMLIFSSCKKDIKALESLGVDPSENKAPIPPFPFAWETADYMPTPPGISIQVPWASGANQMFSPDIAYDFLQVDGWELVYNTFNMTALTSPSFFALYNKYRGLLRFYIWLPPGSPAPSTYINSGLNLSGSGTSSMLNYIAQDAVDINVNQRDNVKAEGYQLQATGGWYATQYEICYDPTISGISYQDLNMVWNTQSINLTNIELFGTQTGTLKGTISQPATGFNISASGLPTSLAQGALHATGLGIWNNNSASALGLPQNIYDAIKSGLTSGLSGVVKNLLSGIFGGSSGSTQQVNLTLNTQIRLQGSLTNNSGLGMPTLVIPGSLNSQSAPGFIPGYNSPMGIFNISAKPTVSVSTTVQTIQAGMYSVLLQFSSTLSINSGSFQTLFNPALLANASIQNFKQELVLLNPSPPYSTNGVLETIGNRTAYTGVTSYVQRFTFSISSQGNFQLNPTFGTLAVRFSFDVVPNNPNVPPSKIVKTFLVTPL